MAYYCNNNLTYRFPKIVELGRFEIYPSVSDSAKFVRAKYGIVRVEYALLGCGCSAV